MPICRQCEAAEAEVGLLCRGCVELNKRTKAERQQLYDAGGGASTTASGRGLDLKFFLYGAVGLAALAIVANIAGLFGYGELPALAGGARDGCSGKKSCLVVVFAPWCGACKASIPFVQAVSRYAASRSDLGVQVVIGLDDVENLRRMASQVGGSTITDQSGAIYRALGGGGVPRWGVIDEARKITNRGSGLPGGISDKHPMFTRALEQMGLPAESAL